MNVKYVVYYNIENLLIYIGLAILSCISFEFEFTLSKKFKVNLFLEGGMMMTMIFMLIKMVAVGVPGVCLAKSII